MRSRAMNSRQSFQAAAKQRGFTIVELMIAGMLGLVLLAGVGQLFLGSSQTFRLQRQVADIQDNGRFAVWFLKTDLERAGWFPNLTADETLRLQPDSADDGGDDANDAITITYGDPAGAGVDCTGTAVGAQVQNRYFIDANSNLVCQGNGGLTQPLVANVDGFQILYGVDVANPPEPNPDDVCLDRAADQYVRASDLAGGELIVAVRFAVLIAGQSNSSVPATSRSYQVGDRLLSFDDKIIRRVFSLTVPIRNAQSAVNCPKAST